MPGLFFWRLSPRLAGGRLYVSGAAMTSRFSLLALALVGFTARVVAADEPTPTPATAPAPEPKSHLAEILKARAAEDAKKKPATPAAEPITPTAQAVKAEEKNPLAIATAPAAPTAPASSTPAKDAPAPAPTAAQQPPTMLPKVEVKKDRVTVLDHNLAMQDKEIAREKKNTTPTELDKALNDSKVSKTLSIFGGQSGDYRANVSKERVQMMEDEKEVMEAIAHAKTKEEKAELQKELDQLRALRRDLEKSMR